MTNKPSYKQALISEILTFKNNEYTEIELLRLRATACQSILSDLILSRGNPIQKMTSQEMMMYSEMQWH